jgi:hypothetical protein
LKEEEITDVAEKKRIGVSAFSAKGRLSPELRWIGWSSIRRYAHTPIRLGVTAPQVA